MDSNDLKAQLKAFANRIDAMSLRERALIFITMLVALYFLFVNVLFGPLNTSKDRLQQQVNQLHSETQALEIQVQSLVASGQDPEAAKRQKVAALRENIRALDSDLERVTTGLVSPKEMARLMEQMLLKNRGLQILKLESLPAMPLVDDAVGADGKSALVYKHGMNIEVKGGYLDILRYLKSIEGLPWKVFWGKVSLKTEKHPDSRVSLLIYTLSTHEAWIGL